MLAVAKRVKSGMLMTNAWHARSDAASSLVVGIGIIGNLAGFPILDHAWSRPVTDGLNRDLGCLVNLLDYSCQVAVLFGRL